MTQTTDSRIIDVFETDLGWMAILTHDDMLQRLTFGHETAAKAGPALAADAGEADLDDPRRANERDWDSRRELIGQLVAYAAGRPVDFSELVVDESQWSGFQRRVLSACRRIPYGQLQTYGHLAAAVGSPAAARAVGRVMAT